MSAMQQGLIGRLYQAALDDRAWAALCGEMAEAFGAIGSGVVILPPSNGKQFLGRSSIFSDDIIASYEQYYWQRDVWAERASRLGMAQVFSTADIIADRDFERTEFYADYCRQMDLYYAIGSVFPIADGHLGLLGIQRVRGQGAYSARDKAAAEALLPHLQRALQIRYRVAGSEACASIGVQALEALGTAVMLVDASLEIHFANQAARSLLGADLAASLHAAGCSSSALAQAVRSATAKMPTSRCLRLARKGGAPLILTVAPFQPQEHDGAQQALASSAGRPCALVMARDPLASLPSARAMQQLFDLTPSESLLCQSLARGLSLDEIASAGSISIHTVKSHLQHVFGKTGTCRQAELVALMHQCSPA